MVVVALWLVDVEFALVLVPFPEKTVPLLLLLGEASDTV